MTEFNWSELAFGSKKEINELRPIFIAAPRDMSVPRFKALIKQYLPQSNILLGISREDYVLGLENQPQFKMLKLKKLNQTISKVNSSKLKNKVYVLHHSQHDTKYIFAKLKLSSVVLVNGSWYQAYHYKPEFYTLVQKGIVYEKISPFENEAEAIEYCKLAKFEPIAKRKNLSEQDIMEILNKVAKRSYDYGGYQIGAALATRQGTKYQLLQTAHNKIVPFETYAMHYGASREINFSPHQDLNHYDTIHAEVELILLTQKNKINLKNTSLFINLLPCPICTRMLMDTQIEEVVYTTDHSEGYAVKMLEKSHKIVRRIAS